MINQNVLKALNNQLNNEFYSAYLYLSMSNYFSDIGFFGFSKWMIKQAEEEKCHAMDFYNYIKTRESAAELINIDTPNNNWNSPMHVFQEALKHEKYVTNSIHDILKIANTEEDFATGSFLEKYVIEQVEEEKTLNDILKRFNAFDDGKVALFLLDEDLGKRAE